MPLIHAIPPAPGRRGQPRWRQDTLCTNRGHDHDKYRRQACKVGITRLIGPRGEAYGSGPDVYRCTLVDHLTGLNGPLRCMIGVLKNEDVGILKRATFYSDLHHNGMYVGGGMMVHAPQTGDAVKMSASRRAPSWAAYARSLDRHR
ncbi:hypothetical protein [Microbispora rosea]|uniref:hypothetical protein n=1 Tax=Microbispora rosea TaxID=58117 RepID=UPI0012DDBEF6|nr:hypothetical protein [Microbispora rosea]